MVEEELAQSIKSKIEQEQKKEDILKNALNYTSTGAKKRRSLFARDPSRSNILRSLSPPKLKEKTSKKQVQIPRIPE
jgi:hypothetical protein